MSKGSDAVTISRRSALLTLGAGAASLAMPSISRAATTDTIRIGFVSPMTGALGQFGETDTFTLNRIRAFLANGLEIGGKHYAVEILSRDGQSNPNHAAELAGDLILNHNVHIMVPASTTDTVNPVADQCELYGVPSASQGAPWQAFVMPRGGDKKPFRWTFHFFWGLEDVLGAYVGLWKSVETNKKIGMLFPRNTDGEVWGSEKIGLPPAVRAAGFEAIAPNMYQPRTNDFSAQIAEFKRQNCDIVGGLTLVSDMKTFVTQCSQQGYHPKVVTLAAGLLFPSGVESLGELGTGLSTEIWWTPVFPFKSSLTGESSADIARTWETETKKQWTQPLGYSHAIWEVVIDVLKRSKNPLDRAANRDALEAIDLQTVVGRISFKNGPTPNICKTPIFGGQWVKGAKYPFDLKVVDNSVWPFLKPEGKLQLMSWS